MVGRGPFQVQQPNIGENNTYSNQLPMKTQSFDIQSIKREPVSQTVSEMSTSKFSGFFGYSAFVQEVPQFPYDNRIYVSPIEELTNNPYKMLEQKEDGSVSFQKYPMLQDEQQQNWPSNNDGANYIPPFAVGKKGLSEKDEDILAQLFDLTGMLNDEPSYDIPSHDDMLIPVQTPSPSMVSEPTNQIQTPYQPAELSPQGLYSSPSTDNIYYNNGQPYSAASPDNNTDPLVSVFNDGLSPPNNDLYPGVNPAENDDLQILLNDILTVENFPLENNQFTPDNPYSNEIPSLPMISEEENNEVSNNNGNSTEDTLIPFDTFQFPPPAKKRLSESSSMEESPPPSIPSSIHMESNLSPIESIPSPQSTSSDNERDNQKTPTQKQRLSTNLFGQKEDEIIVKLLAPKRGSRNKPITRDKLVTMNVEDFNALLDQVGLTEIEVAFMKEWRRRGKNKMAAQIARKRKRDELSELRDEIELLRRQKAQLKQSASSLKTTLTSFKRRAQAAEERIYKKYSAAHGLLVSKETHNIHVTDDGKTMLVPRISSQVLLV